MQHRIQFRNHKKTHRHTEYTYWNTISECSSDVDTLGDLVALDEKNSKTVKRKSADIKVMSFELFSKKNCTV